MLAFSFSDLFSPSSWKEQLKSSLSDAQSKLEAKVGTFLTTGETIRDAKARAQSQQNSSKSDVKSQAAALVARANGLLTQYDGIKSTATSTLGKLTDLQNQFQTNPVLTADNPQSMGTRIVELFTLKRQEILDAATGATQLAVRVQAHITDTNNLVSSVSSLERYAAGEGFSAGLDKIGSAATSNLLAPVAKVAVVGLLAYFLLPSLLAKGAKSLASK